MPEADNLATQAFQKYDAAGEQAMLNFIAENILKAPDPGNTCWTQGIFTLKDRSVIHHIPNVAYYQPPSRRTEKAQERPSALNTNAYPNIIPNLIPMMSQPNTDSLTEAVIMLIEDRAAEADPKRNRDQEPTPEHLIFQAAPSLKRAIIAAVTDYRPSPKIEQLLDTELTNLAHEVLSQIPPEQMANLIAAAPPNQH